MKRVSTSRWPVVILPVLAFAATAMASDGGEGGGAVGTWAPIGAMATAVLALPSVASGAPKLQVSPKRLDFGTMRQGDERRKVLYLSNRIV